MWLLLFLLALLVPGAHAAQVSGGVYGPDLSSVSDAVLNVNTTPEQVLVITNGSYRIELPSGDYLLSMASGELSDKQIVRIRGNGSFVRDFILLPQLDLPDAPGPPVVDPSGNATRTGSVPVTPQRRPLWLVIIIGVAILGLAAWFVLRRRTRSDGLDGFERAVIEALIKHDGRATQKQIRSEVPFSEAKVSLVISDLADRGLVRKFKRGRGNIVVLERDQGTDLNETQGEARSRRETDEPEGPHDETERNES